MHAHTVAKDGQKDIAKTKSLRTNRQDHKSEDATKVTRREKETETRTGLERTTLCENDANAVIRPIRDENILEIVDCNARRAVERGLVAPRVLSTLF